jgi:hypothetical protein
LSPGEATTEIGYALFASMKHKLAALTKAYLVALREHQREGSQLSLQPALGLGCRACVLGMDALQMARLHKRATVKLNLPPTHGIAFKRAQRFLKDALIPLLKMDGLAPQSTVRLNRLHQNLDSSTAQLTAAKVKLQDGVVNREVLVWLIQLQALRLNHLECFFHYIK